MARMSAARCAELRRATERARATLRPGDRLRVNGCGGTSATVTMTGWCPLYPNWITSKSRDDIHAMHITKVNGVPTSFADPPGFVPPPITRRDRIRHWLSPRLGRMRLRWVHFRACHLPSLRLGRVHCGWDEADAPYGRRLRLHWPRLGTLTLDLVRETDDDVPF